MNNNTNTKNSLLPALLVPPIGLLGGGATALLAGALPESKEPRFSCPLAPIASYSLPS